MKNLLPIDIVYLKQEKGGTVDDAIKCDFIITGIEHHTGRFSTFTNDTIPDKEVIDNYFSRKNKPG